MSYQYQELTRRLSVVAFALAGLACTSGAEFRGLWVDAFGAGFFNAGQVKQLAEDCRKYNFNAVVVEMRRRGDAFYHPQPPNPDPRTTIITTNFDALAEIIRQCHTGTPRIEVHCWLVSHFIWAWDKPPIQPGHVFNRHPEYLTQDSIGQKRMGKGWFLDPGHPGANQTVFNTAKDIVSRYDIDGLHWDYFRYPNRDSGYNETALRRYNEEFGLQGQPAPDDPRFCEWRRRQVTDALRWINADLLEIKPGLKISVSVFANLDDAYGHRFQDWAAWTKEGLLDICMPMNFSADNARIFEPRLGMAWENQGIRHVCVGQAAYLNPPENTVTQLKDIRARGFPGHVLYSYRSPNVGKAERARTLASIKAHIQPTWVETPALPWKTNRAIIKGTVTRTDTGQPIYNATVTLNTDPARTQKTGPNGKYAFFDVPSGDYNLAARSAGTNAYAPAVKARAGECITVDMGWGVRDQ